MGALQVTKMVFSKKPWEIMKKVSIVWLFPRIVACLSQGKNIILIILRFLNYVLTGILRFKNFLATSASNSRLIEWH